MKMLLEFFLPAIAVRSVGCPLPECINGTAAMKNWVSRGSIGSGQRKQQERKTRHLKWPTLLLVSRPFNAGDADVEMLPRDFNKVSVISLRSAVQLECLSFSIQLFPKKNYGKKQTAFDFCFILFWIGRIFVAFSTKKTQWIILWINYWFSLVLAGDGWVAQISGN